MTRNRHNEAERNRQIQHDETNMQQKRTQPAANSIANAAKAAKSDARSAVGFGDWTVVAGYELIESYTIRKDPTADLLASVIDRALAFAG
ncbi:MAG: hypothetical protein IPK16_20210 [Anaerolineales bacterium]|nr:hypothetical protein [Anaerolineales bacterium]